MLSNATAVHDQSSLLYPRRRYWRKFFIEKGEKWSAYHIVVLLMSYCLSLLWWCFRRHPQLTLSLMSEKEDAFGQSCRGGVIGTRLTPESGDVGYRFDSSLRHEKYFSFFHFARSRRWLPIFLSATVRVGCPLRCSTRTSKNISRGWMWWCFRPPPTAHVLWWVRKISSSEDAFGRVVAVA